MSHASGGGQGAGPRRTGSLRTGSRLRGAQQIYRSARSAGNEVLGACLQAREQGAGGVRETGEEMGGEAGEKFKKASVHYLLVLIIQSNKQTQQH